MSKPEQKLTAWLVDFCTQMSNTQSSLMISRWRKPEMSKTVLLIIGSFQISIFMNGESTVKTKILIWHILQVILHLHTLSRENPGESRIRRDIKKLNISLFYWIAWHQVVTKEESLALKIEIIHLPVSECVMIFKNRGYICLHLFKMSTWSILKYCKKATIGSYLWLI